MAIQELCNRLHRGNGTDILDTGCKRDDNRVAGLCDHRCHGGALLWWPRVAACVPIPVLSDERDGNSAQRWTASETSAVGFTRAVLDRRSPRRLRRTRVG